MQRKATPDFDAVYREHADRVFRYCRALCRNDDAEAQDVAQETFIRAYRSLEQFEGRSSMLTWLVRIARREWIRRNAREKETFLLEEAELPDPAGDLAIRETRRIWLQEALARLPEQQREAVVLVKVDGLTHREAAEVLEIPQGTVQFHVSQGIRQLRRLLVDEGAPGLTALLLVLFLQREMQAAVTAPPELAERVYASIGRPYPSPGGALPGSSGNSAGGRSAVWRRRSLGAMGGLLLFFLGVLAWKRNTAGPAPSDPLQSVLRAMSQVKTAHATGTSQLWSTVRGSTYVSTTNTVDYWYKLPSSYRVSARGHLAPHNELAVQGGKAVMLAVTGSKTIDMPTSAESTELMLSAFAVFTPDGLFAKIARAKREPATPVNAEWENRSVQLFSLEQLIAPLAHRWLLYVDPTTHQVLRIEYSRWQLVGGTLQPRKTETLEHFEYDVAIPDSKFQLSH